MTDTARSIELMEALPMVFGGDWLFLTRQKREAIVKDCIDWDITDLAAYRKDIGSGNLNTYAICCIHSQEREEKRRNAKG